jgi:hypothetical protein
MNTACTSLHRSKVVGLSATSRLKTAFSVIIFDMIVMASMRHRIGVYGRRNRHVQDGKDTDAATRMKIFEHERQKARIKQALHTTTNAPHLSICRL